MRAIIGPQPLTPEWFEAHDKYISATAIARIMAGEGVAVWGEMTGRLPRFQGNKATRRGQRHEAMILQDYADDTNALVCGGLPMMIDPDCPCLAATPDAFALALSGPSFIHWKDYIGKEIPEGSWGVEAKDTLSPAVAMELGEAESDWVPDKWMWQTQVQMAVTGWDRVDVAINLYGSLKVLRVKRNETLIAKCRVVAVDMMDHVTLNIQPELSPLDFSKEASQDAIKQLYGVNEGEIIDLSEAVAEAWEQYQQLGGTLSDLNKQVKAVETPRKTQQAIVLAGIGNAAFGKLPSGRLIKHTKVVVEERIAPGYTYPKLSLVK